MDPIVALLAIFGLILAFVLAGMRIAFALGLVGLIGLTWIVEPAQPQIAGSLMWDASVSFTLTAVPLFVFMAEVLVRSGVSVLAYRNALQWFGAVPGGGAYATVLGSAAFAAMSGSSVANAAAMGTIAGKQLVDSGYDKKLTFGTIAAGGTLGILIPPSTALIIYGSLTGESIGHLFMAGLVPGLVGVAFFFVIVGVWVAMSPGAAPRLPAVPLRERVRGLAGVLPTLALLVVVLGGIYAGVFSPSEAAGIGAFAAMVLAALSRALTFRMLHDSLQATVALTGMIMLIIAAATVVTYVVGILGIPASLSQLIVDSGLSVWIILILVALLFTILGCFIESVSLIVLTIPVLYPVMTALGVDGVWLGIYVVILVEIGLLTPPVGLNLFVLQKIPAGQTLRDIAHGVLPYLGALALLLVFLVFAPGLATWLPSNM